MRMAAPKLLPMFRSDAQVALLALLMLQPDRSWTLDALTAGVGAPQSSVHRELQRLLSAGLITREAAQRPHRYRAATDAPAYQPLHDLLNVTAGVPARLSRDLAEVPGVIAAAIHGSWATGRVRPVSDVDIIIVTDGDRRAALQAVRAVGKDIGRDVDASILSRDDFDQMRRSQNPFLGKVLHGPRIDLIGDLSAIGDAP